MADLTASVPAFAPVPVRVAFPARASSPRPAGSVVGDPVARAEPGDVPGEGSGTGPLTDRYGRVHTDLRISVTDRCNLRCDYCMPEEGVPFRPRSQILTFEEVARVAAAAHHLGVRSVRFTGGEPLVRRDLDRLVAMVAALGFDDVALTTNGMLLAPMAARLAAAGLDRVNVSCDSLRPDRFARIRRRGDLATVLSAMDAAEAAGLGPVKVNVVLMAGVNDDEVEAFATFGRRTGREVRFIEYMPLDAQGTWRRDQVVPAEDVLARIATRWPIEAVGPAGDPAPAERFEFVDGAGAVGVVASVTRPFCGSCNRLRLTADGALRNCLFSDDEVSVREILRSGVAGTAGVTSADARTSGDDGGDGDDDGVGDALARAFRAAVGAKRPGHGIDDPGFLRPARSMSMIGG